MNPTTYKRLWLGLVVAGFALLLAADFCYLRAQAAAAAPALLEDPPGGAPPAADAEVLP